ncbi:MAG TPA: cellulase family glycosylhydrolase, partial [Mucilaginibacter sp.]
MPQERAVAFKRAVSLDNGISISWLEQTWKRNILDTNEINSNDFKLLSQLGIKTIRLPVAFEYFELQHIPIEKVFVRIDQVVKQCDKYGFKLIIDNHYGSLNDTNYQQETQRIIDIWKMVANRYMGQNPDNLFFEPYNEPPH